MSEIKYGLFKYEVKDYHSILGVPLDATPQEIRSRYLKIAYQLHPDTCRAATAQEKEKASQILSKLVNPAYENLSKNQLRKECQLILSEIGRRLATDAYQITIVSDTAKKLFQEEYNLEKVYKGMIEQISPNLYTEIDKIITKIALISELNMVYLIRKKDSEHKHEVSNFASAAATIQATEAITNQAPSSQNNSKTSVSEEESTGSLGNSVTDKIKKLISTTQQHQQDGNLEQGILDLREALKLDPNNSTCHALIGSLYLQQGNTTYARVHIKKATELNSNDPMVKQASKDLKEWEAKQKSTSGQKEKSSVVKGQKASKSKGKEAKGKKEPPKIFGIPLW